MALARVVTFEGVDAARMEEMKKQIGEGDRPQEVPATEIVVLLDPEREKSLVVLLFDNENDYRQADAFLGGMPASDTPGRRTSVTKYDVAVHRTG